MRPYLRGHDRPRPGFTFRDGRGCGPDSPVLIAFEIGPTVTDLHSARALLLAAAEAGADAIKCQMLDAAALIGRDVPVRWRAADGQLHEESMRAVLERRALSVEDWRLVRQQARDLGQLFFVTVDGASTLGLAEHLDVDALKVCSGDVTHLDLVRQIARAGRPIMLDTGMATLGEVEAAVDAARSAGNSRIVIHHCGAGYPSALEGLNLRVLLTLRQMFPECVIAYSDHAPRGLKDAMNAAAVALGAEMLEVTLTLDRTADGPEHAMSLEPAEADAFVRMTRAVETAMGSPRRILTDAERVGKGRARRSAFLTRALHSGATITADAIAWRRPAEGGIEPAEAHRLIGRPVRRFLDAGQQLTWSDLVGEAV